MGSRLRTKAKVVATAACAGGVAGSSFAAGARTLLEVLRETGALGFGSELRAVENGHVVCGDCDASSPARDMQIERTYRLEGASDPADQQLVLCARCPACERDGVLVLGYGPTASRHDVALVDDVDLGDSVSPVTPLT